MPTYADSLMGAGTNLYGSPVESTSEGVYVWENNGGDMRRAASGATLPTVSNGQCEFYPFYDGVETFPPLVTVEGEFNTEGTTAERLAELEFRWTVGSVWCGASVRQYYAEGNYRIYANNGSFITAYNDSATYSGYVKRRIEVNYTAKTFKCFANDVQIAAGGFSTDLTPSPGAINTSILVFLYRANGTTPTTCNVRNMSVEIGTPPPPAPPGVFWTGFVNAYEVL